MAKKKLKGISYNYDNRTKTQGVIGAELKLREAFLRATREDFDNFGIDKYSIEKLRGMTDLLEQFVIVSEEVDEL